MVWGVAASGLWILGASLLLATWSVAWWRSRVQRPSLRAVLAQAGVQRTLWLGLVLFSAGMAATGRLWWESGLWGALALFWTIRAWLARSARS